MGEETTPQPPSDGALEKRSYVKIRPEQYEEIGKLWAQGKTYRWIARKFNCYEKVVAEIVQKHVLPAVQVNPARSVEAILLKYSVIESRLWECILADEPAETREQVQQVLSQAGSQGAPKHEIVELITKTLTRRPNNGVYYDLLLKVLDKLCLLEGHYAPKRVRFENEERRVAGQTPDEVKAERIKNILARTEQVMIREALLRGETIDVIDAEFVALPHETNGKHHVDPE